MPPLSSAIDDPDVFTITPSESTSSPPPYDVALTMQRPTVGSTIKLEASDGFIYEFKMADLTSADPPQLLLQSGDVSGHFSQRRISTTTVRTINVVDNVVEQLQSVSLYDDGTLRTNELPSSAAITSEVESVTSSSLPSNSLLTADSELQLHAVL